MAWIARASPVTRVRFRGQRVHVKRDDVFHLAGNKMRKLYWLLQQNDAFFQDVHVVSFGGSQSNAMLAIAQLAHAKAVPFTYFSRSLNAPHYDGDDNLSMAKALGMRHIELASEEYKDLAASKDLADVAKRFVQMTESKPLYVPQGAAFAQAEDGLRVLAQELNSYCHAYDQHKEFSVVVPCGTGTTAFYLAQHVHPALRVFAVPCVGDHEYLNHQFDEFAALDPLRTMTKPALLVPSRKARFGRLSAPLLTTYNDLREATAIEFDLLYAAFAWQTLFEPQNLTMTLDGETALQRELLYVHTGGVSGNGSMLARYHAKQIE